MNTRVEKMKKMEKMEKTTVGNIHDRNETHS